ncbi:MAG: DUF2179 domain-containing protein [Trueperaceae bacterium]|nr:MAG: DUF2179 domain-containing protein [Trueperaceae bacterium]
MLEIHIPPISLAVISGMLLIFAMRVIDVSLGTLRMIFIVRGLRLRAALISFFEVTIWVLAVSQVITNLGHLWNLLGYSSGFAMGTLVGIWLEGKLALGQVDVRIFSTTKGKDIAEGLRQAGFGVTELHGSGRSGEVDVVATVVPRRSTQQIVKLASAIDGRSFITVDDMKEVRRGYVYVKK